MSEEKQPLGVKQLYSSTVTALEGLYDFHPDYFEELNAEDRDVLGKFYFAGRDIDVEDIQVYREQLLKEDPEILKRAQAALKRFYELHNIPAEPGEY